MFCKRAPFLIFLAPLLLGGCMAQSRVQAKYMDHEADCRNEAQLRALDFQKTGVTGLTADTAAERSYAIGAAFSECMTKQGWKVGVPKPPATAVAAVPPPSGAPGPGGTVAAAAPVTVTTTRVSTAPDNAATTTVTTMTAPPGTQLPVAAPEVNPANTQKPGPNPAGNPAIQRSQPPSRAVQNAVEPAMTPSSYNRYVPQQTQGAGRQF